MHRIQQFDTNGSFIRQWGGQGTGNGQFQYPGSIAADSNGHLYVADLLNQRVQKFDADGNFLLKWGSQGDGPGQFTAISYLAVGPDDLVYVADNGDNAIEIFDGDGNTITSWDDSALFQAPQDMLVNADDTLFVLDSSLDRVQHITPPCMNVTRFLSEHPQATGPSGTGSGIQGGYWHITTTGQVTVHLSLPHPDFSQPKACRYTNGTGAGWDCDTSSFNSTHVTRNNVGDFSDWAVGENVGPTAVQMSNATAIHHHAVRWWAVLIVMLLILTTFVLIRHQRGV